MIWPRSPLASCLLAAPLACVPKESADGSNQPLEGTHAATRITHWKPPAVSQLRAARGDSDAAADTDPASDESLTEDFSDDFDRNDLGPDWLSTGRRWFLRDGRVCGQGARNHPLWLKRRLPDNARITFTARSLSPEGDIKVEAWGSGRAYAHGQSYDDATSYLFIFGGWKNRLHVLARLNEHGRDRLELRVEEGQVEPPHAPVIPHRDYHFVIQRSDGRTVSWEVDDAELLRYEDRAPLKGTQHDHFAFNNWAAEVCFDDLVIVPLE